MMDSNEQLKCFVGLGKWVQQHEDAIITALRKSYQGNYPLKEVTKFEKALDEMPVIPSLKPPEEKFW